MRSSFNSFRRHRVCGVTGQHIKSEFYKFKRVIAQNGSLQCADIMKLLNMFYGSHHTKIKACTAKYIKQIHVHGSGQIPISS